jgi:glycosyltransferase involved in cell wall biosynthesis
MPFFSIIIPSYNRAYLLSETLISIKNQTYEDWECIIVDDGSTDNTKDVISAESLIDSRIKSSFLKEINSL